MSQISRRSCLGASSIALACLALDAGALTRNGGSEPEVAAGDGLADFPAQPRQLVREMVGASHGNVERVAALLKERPQLATAAWDHGFGDWETALGAASHVGNREIALMLMEHGARPDLFTFAMLGNLDAVRAVISATPGIERLRGPHGFTLAHHARVGGENAASVAAYLATLPDADVPYPSVALEAEARSRYLGVYRYGTGRDETVEVGYHERRSVLTLGRGGGGGGGGGQHLTYLGEHTFHPGGAPDVRIVFHFAGGAQGPANGLEITAPLPILRATRV